MKEFAAPSAKLARARATAGAHPQMSYSLLLRHADGSYLPVSPGTVFHTGDAVRVQAEAAVPGYIYLFRKSDAGDWRPVARVTSEPGHLYAIPAEGALQSLEPGKIELRLVFGPAPDNALQPAYPAFEALSATAGQASFHLVLEFR